MLINKISAYYKSIKRQGLGLKHCDDSKAFIEYSNDMQDAYKNIGVLHISKTQSIMNNLWRYDMITDMLNNKKFNRTTYLRKKTRHFSCFYYTIIFHSNEKCYTKFYAFFITTITTNKGNYSSNLIIHQILTLSTLLIFTRKYTANHIHF